jgi:hypothetical protein
MITDHRHEQNEALNEAAARTYTQIGWLAFVGLAIVAAVVVIWLRGP